MFYYEDDVLVKMFFISGNGFWMVGPDITGISGGLRSEERGLLTPPRTGWRYADKGTFHSDDTLQLIF